MKKTSTSISIMFALALLLAFCTTVQASSSSCLVCHNSMSGKIALESGQEIDLKVDGEKYQASVHGFMACTECHIRFGEDPHKSPAGTVPENIDELSKKIGHKARVDAVAYSACVNCHEGIYDMVLESPHGENIVSKNEMDAALCLDCHGSPHYIVTAENEGSRVNQWSVVETCGHCHGDKELTEKYNIETNVLTSYIESFHGKKHHLGHKGAPTCVNCHGAHDIKRKDDPSSPVFEANKKATCGKCHKGATDKFVAAITHKPVGPIPHYMEIGLILLTLSTFAFIISHVILEAFSDIRDALSKKKEARK